MVSIVKSVWLALVLCAAFTGASASTYTDDMSKCLVKSATAEDRVALMRWVFLAMASSPTVKSMVNISAEQHSSIEKKAGALIQRLMTVDCRAETIAALKHDGESSIETAFGALGEDATTGLFADPEVDKTLSGLTEGMDLEELGKLFKEAGISEGQDQLLTDTPTK